MSMQRTLADEQRAPRPEARSEAADVLWARFAGAEQAQDFLRAWLALQCGRIAGVHAALLVMEEGGGAYVPAAVWPNAAADVTYLGAAARACLVEREGRAEAAPDGSARVFVAYPLESAGRLFGAVVLDVAARAEDALQEVLRELHWGAGWLEVVLQRRQLEQHAEAMQRSQAALDLAALVGEHATLDEAAMALAGEIAARFDCERVAIGFERKGRVRLRAVSHAAWFDRKSQYSAALENAMEEAIDQRRTVAHPPLAGAASPIAVAHRDCSPQTPICTLVLAQRGYPIGAISCLRKAGFDAALVATLEAVAALAAPQLALKRELGRWFAGRLVDQLRRLRKNLADPRRLGFRVGALALVAVLGVLALAEGEHRVGARAVIEGEVQRAVAAPFDGFVASASIRAGERVRAGQVLATLDDRDLKLEQQRWFSEREQAERKYRDALARHDRAAVRILAAQLAESEAQLALVTEKLERTQLAAPFDGVVVSGDLSQILGSPVEKGKLLFEVAPLDAYRVILKVEETDIRDVRVGQAGQLVLAGLTRDALAFTVKNIAIASAEEGKNLFRVEARLAQAAPALRPGMEGVGKIVVGERRLLWIWTHAFFDWLRLKLWQWLP